MTILTIDYAVLLITFLIVASYVLKTADDENRNSGCGVMKMAEKDGFLKEMMSRIRARLHTSDI